MLCIKYVYNVLCSMYMYYVLSKYGVLTTSNFLDNELSILLELNLRKWLICESPIKVYLKKT